MSQSNYESLDENDKEQYWRDAYDARAAWFQEHVGPLPEHILKLGHLFGVWPGGGLFQFPATNLGDLWAHTTFGFTNPGMPAATAVEDVAVEHDEQGRPTTSSSRLVAKENPRQPSAGNAGYGYELLILTKEECEWPLWALQWACNAELLSDVDLLGRVEEYEGFTVGEVKVGEQLSANLLIAPAQPPLPSEWSMPNGKARLLIATAITDDEVDYSIERGRPALLGQLLRNGPGQVSNLERESVVG